MTFKKRMIVEIFKMPEIDTIKVFLPCGSHVLISYEDEWLLKDFPCWKKGKTGRYATCVRKIKTEYSNVHEILYLHRLIMGTTNKSGRYVDHINGNRLDNRRSNLRIATPKQNSANKRAFGKSGLKGVDVRSDKKNLFRCSITLNGSCRNVGFFKNQELAAKCYDINSIAINSEFSWLNYPQHSEFYSKFINKHKIKDGLLLGQYKGSLVVYRPYGAGDKRNHIGNRIPFSELDT